jgi:hypothetical protein
LSVSPDSYSRDTPDFVGALRDQRISQLQTSFNFRPLMTSATHVGNGTFGRFLQVVCAGQHSHKGYLTIRSGQALIAA